VSDEVFFARELAHAHGALMREDAFVYLDVSTVAGPAATTTATRILQQLQTYYNYNRPQLLEQLAVMSSTLLIIMIHKITDKDNN